MHGLWLKCANIISLRYSLDVEIVMHKICRYVNALLIKSAVKARINSNKDAQKVLFPNQFKRQIT